MRNRTAWGFDLNHGSGEALAARDIALGPRQVRRHLRRLGAGYHRTARRSSTSRTRPELNQIEPVFRQVKYQEIPEQSHMTRIGLREAVDHGFRNYYRKLLRKSLKELRSAA